jgi:two-component system, chemotaxis family, chemotaxis protein CheY
MTFEQQSLLGSDQDFSAIMNAARHTMPRLLVIDDDNLHRMIICRVAAKAGFLPAGAASYDEAVKLAQETAFDCITLDLSLGNHAGTEMLHHLSMLGSTVPIIVVSGADYATCKETVKVAEMLNLDIWECIPKPVDLVMLRHFLERLKASWNTVAVAA